MSNNLLPKSSIASLFRELADAAESNATPDFTIRKKGQKITIIVDSSSDERFINSKEVIPGINRTTIEQITKLPVEERRKLVRNLHINEKLNQTEISEKTLYSQKTISNDLKVLRDRGEL